MKLYNSEAGKYARDIRDSLESRDHKEYFTNILTYLILSDNPEANREDWEQTLNLYLAKLSCHASDLVSAPARRLRQLLGMETL